jgi:hypothetical protein
VQGFEAGSPLPLPLSLIEIAFAPHALHLDPSHLRLAFPNADGTRDTTDIDVDANGDPPTWSNAMFNRPKSNLLFYDGLLRLLRSGNCVAYTADCGAAAIGREATLPHLPQNLVETLGVVLCRDSRDLTVALFGP